MHLANDATFQLILMNVQYLANLIIVIHVHTTVLPNHYKFQDINVFVLFFLDFD